MQHASLLRKSLVLSQLRAATAVVAELASTSCFSIHARMASTSSDSGLYRTTSASTVSSSLDGHPRYTTSSTSLTAAHPGQAGHDLRDAAMLDVADQRKKPKRKKVRVKKKKALVSLPSTSAPIFLPATTASSNTHSSASPAKSVANTGSTDMKGKGKAPEEELDTAEDKEELNFPKHGRMPEGQPLETAVETVEHPLPSPAESGTSSTDELPYIASATASPHVTPQAKKIPTQAITHASPLAKTSPFKPPLTGFDFLASRNAAVFGATSPAQAPATISPGGLGIAGKGLEDMPSKLAENTQEPSKAEAPTRAAVSEAGKKKVAASPLTWSSDHRPVDAPTLGSPTLGSLTNHRSEEEALSSAITKASFSAGQQVILQELAKRKALRRQFEQEQRNSEAEHADLVYSVQREKPAANGVKTSPEARVNEIAATPTKQDADGVIRRDTIAPQWKALLSPKQASVRLAEEAAPLQMASSVERSPLLGNGTTSGTADAEEDFDDGASDASQTSALIRSVARDSDMSRGWEDLDTSFNAKSKARQRLQDSIYELNKRHRPSPAIIAARQEMLTAIRKRLNWLLGEDFAPDFQYHLKTFGSTAYGLDTDSSDLDLCIIDPRRPDGFRNAADLYDVDQIRNGPDEVMPSTEEDEEHRNTTPMQRFRKNKRWAEPAGRKPLVLDEIYNIVRLANLLRKMGHEQVVAIPGAVVPIVKFKSPGGIKADMNPNEQLGVRNSALLAQYVSYKPIIRPFLIFIKVWAKQRRINDPSGRGGPMSLSSYSLVLMAIAYLQHAGVLPNLQDADLIAKHGVPRHTFWTKVPNPDISKGRQRAKYKYLGDYRAMAVDTTFVRADMLRSQPQQAHPTKTGNGKKARRNSHGNVQRQRMVSIGWDSDTASDTPIASDESPKPEELLKLVEGFFEYYLGFPVEDKAISIWGGKPIDRKIAIPKHAGAPYMRGSRKLRKQAQDVQEELSELEEEQSLANASLDANIVRSGSSDSDTVTGSDETAITEDEELAAMHAKLAAQLAKLGIQENGASFEETHKLSKKQRRKQKRELKLLAQSQAQPVMQGIDGLEQVEEAEEEAGEIGINAYKGLHVSEANPKTGLFPVPAVEDPEKFIEPPTWIQQLVVQDPFIHTRNTTMNISPDTVDVIWKEMQRALDMVKAGEPLDKICLGVRHESSYQARPRFKPDAFREERRLQRAARKKEMRERKPRHKTVRRAAEKLANGKGGDQ